jgi:hypothetical protein
MAWHDLEIQMLELGARVLQDTSFESYANYTRAQLEIYSLFSQFFQPFGNDFCFQFIQRKQY